jgi:drug/metabolite transporter (DMT)-like permease
MNKGIILTFTTAIISGVSIFINQYGVKVVNSYIFAGLKNMAVAALLFSVILLFRQWKNLKSLNKKDWLMLTVIGFVGGSVPFLMFFKGLSMSTGPEAAYIHKFMFVFIALLAPFFLKEKIKWPYAIGFVFLAIGSILLYKIKGAITWNNGDSLILGATILWSIENIISKKAVSKISPQIVAWGRMFFGSLFIIIFWIYTHQLGSLATLNMQQINWVFISSVLLFGYVLTWYAGIKYIPITYAAGILALGAPITSLLELIQGKAYSIQQICGISLMFFGIIAFIALDKYLCSRSKKLAATQ